jgi:16S rRNA (guanine527-N7)-methyltransferase
MTCRRQSRGLALTPVSRETEARLDRYVDCSGSGRPKPIWWRLDTPNLWTRHIADSLQLLSLARRPRLGRSRQRRRLSRRGAGLCAGGNAGRHVHLVERNAKKAAFLREASRYTAPA